jgi:hypothetical protein
VGILTWDYRVVKVKVPTLAAKSAARMGHPIISFG